MRCSQLLAIGLATAGVISLSVLSVQSPAQTAGAATSSQPRAPTLGCTPTGNPDPFLPDPFKFRLAGPDFPAGLLPIDEKVKDTILNSGLPCQENVRPNIGEEKAGLENLQRGFDFYSWRTFIALNSPADGTPSNMRRLTSRPCGRTWTISSSCSTSCCRPTCSRRNGRPTKPGWKPSARGWCRRNAARWTTDAPRE